MGKSKNKKPKLTAKTADKHELYQWAVQSPEPDIEFLARVYKKERGKLARHFREDFCGTALLTSEWIKRGPKYTAEGFDIDTEPLNWGRKHNFEPLGESAQRATLHQADARDPSLKSPDVRCAQNFSYWLFTTRAEMLDYFRKVYNDLADDGVFVIDAHGGPDCYEEQEEETKIDQGFTYVWEQKSFSPVTHGAKMRIHFRFKDGSEMKNAFRYEWRFWNIPELREVLLDAGFPRVDCYWEGEDENGEGNGIYRKTKLGTNDPSWVAYLVAPK